MTRTIGGLLATAWVAAAAIAVAEEGNEAPPSAADDRGGAAVTPEAETPDESPNAVEARVQFEQGRDFFNQGAFEKAAIALRRAFELRPSYRILYYLGWAESETGNYNRALVAFERYLKEATPEEAAERIAEVEAEIVKLKARVGHLRVTGGVDGATVKVDNETRGTLPLEGTIAVNVGKHEVVVMDGAAPIFTEVIRIAGGQEIALAVPEHAAETPEEAPVGAAKSAQEATEPAAPKPKRVWTFVAYGAAAAAAVGAGITGALALNQQNAIWDKCDSEGNCYSEDYDGDFFADTDRVRALALTTDVLIGTAALFAVVGTVLIFVEPSFSRESAAPARETTAAAAVPRLYVGPGSLTMTGRF